MIVLNPRDCFAELARAPDERIDLDQAALLIAAEEYPSLDVGAYLERLDRLAEGVAAQLGAAGSDRERVGILNRRLFVEHGFRGNRDDYYDPRNSYLNDVLDRKTGIPLTLSLVYMEVARRLGLAVCGIGFPGHFLVKCVGEEEVVVDPFFGRSLTGRDCEERLREVLGADAVLDPQVHLRAVTPREILVRLLANLKHIRIRSGDFGRALACCERILLLVPDTPVELRDRGLVYEQLECFGAATADLERFLDLAPDDESSAAVAEKLAQLRSKLRRLH